MAIIGFGIDFVEVIRFEKINQNLKWSLAKKILSLQEMEEYKKNSKPAVFLAKRFSAKEAAVKALGTGFCNGLYLNQFEIFNDYLGKPNLNFLGKAKILARSMGVNYIHLSISDIKKYACAAVIIES